MMRLNASQFRSKRLAAFTLLELILAMTMVSMLSISLYAAMSTAYKAKASAERAIKPARAVSIAMDVIVADLEGTVVPNPNSTTAAQDPSQQVGTTIPWFLAGTFYGMHQSGGTGEADWVEFHTLGSDGIPDVPMTEGIRKVAYRVDNDDNGVQCLIRDVTHNLLTDQQTTPESEVLVRNVRSFKVTYYDGTDWYEDWDSTQLVDTSTPTALPAIPMLVQIELVLNIDDWQQPGQEANTYTVTRMVHLALAKPVDTTQSMTGAAPTGVTPG
jgi:type II secretory pathway pseudopilin PulG